MGVPALFRWLSRKYPKIVSPVIETLPDEVQDAEGNITKIPVDATKPNPNGEEFDNLYLDMNGIVHPCSHPEDRPAPANEAEMMTAIFEYTDRVLNMVRPRKLLMIAVDGVAPRAKMNQQRSRRFKSAQEAAEKDKAAAEFYAQLAKGESSNNEDTTEAKPKKTWDSNSITPGTPFMDLLAASLRYWVSYKLSTDPAWEKMKVIISDATVPGEGEHKIMNFIRSQRSSPDHDPNTRHVMYGLDADLIMLGIATHEPHFRILREDVFANDTKPGHCRKCNQPGHIAANCQGQAPAADPTIAKPLKPFIWLHVSILREYLAVEMNVPNLGFRFDLERALDDWVFMCFFVGNDFLPHLPSLDIREDGIDTLIAIWRDNIPVMGGWVTKDGYADQARVQVMLDGLSKQENAIFKRRRENEARAEEKSRRRAEHEQRQSKRMRLSGGEPTGYDETVIRRGPNGGIIKGEAAPDINALPTFAPGAAQTKSDPRYAATLTHADVVGGGRSTHEQASQGNRSAAAALKESLQNSNGANAVLGKRTRDIVEAADDGSTDPSTPGRSTPNAGDGKATTERGTSGALGGNSNDNVDAMPEDSIKLWEDGYQGRYYEQKFHVSANDIEFRRKVANSYVEGLCWVLLYYFQGCPSWTWYYPYHYAPFAQDFFEIEKHEFTFSKGKPFKPYEQLMGVLPAASNHAIPAVFHPLMTDEDSPIKEFYPVDFDVDLNGKKFAWQGVVLLPFIDEKRLLDAMATKYPLLTDDEVRRNEIGNEALIFSTKHPLYNNVVANFYGKKAMHLKFSINTKSSEGLAGTLLKDEAYVPNSELVVPFDQAQHEEYRDLEENDTVRAVYEMPEVTGVHKSMLLPGILFSDPVLNYHDVQQTRDRAERSGRSFGGVQLSQHGDRSDGRRINYSAGDRGGPRGGNWSSAPAASNFQNLPPYLAQQAANHGMPVSGMPYPGGPPPMPPGLPPAHYSGPGGPPPHRGGAGNGYGGGGYGNGEYGGNSYGRNGNSSGGNGNGNGYGYNNGGYNNGGYGNGGHSNGGYNHGGYNNGDSGYGGSGYGGNRHDGGGGRRGRDGYRGGGYGGNANGYGHQNGQGGSGGRRY